MASSTTSNTPPVQRSGLQLGRIWDNFGMLVVFALLFIVCAIFVRHGGLRHAVLPGIGRL